MSSGVKCDKIQKKSKVYIYLNLCLGIVDVNINIPVDATQI